MINKNKIVVIILVIVVIITGIIGFSFYMNVKKPNVDLGSADSIFIYIPTGSKYDEVKDILTPYLINVNSFEWVVEKKNYKNAIKPGKYKVKHGMSNNSLVNLLRSGKQTPVKVVFNKVRTKEAFVGVISQQLEVDSVKLLNMLNDSDFLLKYNKDLHTALTMFIPNTYELYWNTGEEKFIDRMNKESERFWNEKRLNKARKLGLTSEQVYVLASIVEEETIKQDELSKVAGVYMNRLNKGMRLQADPTVRFALADFEVKRILTKHLDIESPYNTYRVNGLPPGPICLPSLKTIDAVLEYEKHSYLYFCAKPDFSGYHAFAKTLVQHNENARQYQRALNKNRIYR